MTNSPQRPMPGDRSRPDPDQAAIQALREELRDMSGKLERLEERLGHVATSFEGIHEIRANLVELKAISRRLHALEVLLRGNGGGEIAIVEKVGRLEERVHRLEAEEGKAEGSRGTIYSRLDDMNARITGLKSSAAVWGGVAGILLTALLSWLLGGA